MDLVLFYNHSEGYWARLIKHVPGMPFEGRNKGKGNDTDIECDDASAKGYEQLQTVIEKVVEYCRRNNISSINDGRFVHDDQLLYDYPEISSRFIMSIISDINRSLVLPLPPSGPPSEPISSLIESLSAIDEVQMKCSGDPPPKGTCGNSHDDRLLDVLRWRPRYP